MIRRGTIWTRKFACCEGKRGGDAAHSERSRQTPDSKPFRAKRFGVRRYPASLFGSRPLGADSVEMTVRVIGIKERDEKVDVE